ncbi:hypothetical protein ABD76_06005 [Paenibacillus dendritiformis]|nr:hypothetical protein [Paenibacillus dendritiformis]
MTRLLFRIMFGFLACFWIFVPVKASHFLSHGGGGYAIEMDVVQVGEGPRAKSTISAVRFQAPGERAYVRLAGGVSVQDFEFNHQLTLVYDGSDGLVPPFKFTVRGTEAVLSINEQEIRSDFEWLM